jgi:hypothetical protein
MAGRTLGLLLLLVAWPAFTQQASPRYNIEIVVFRALGESPPGERLVQVPDTSQGTTATRTAGGRLSSVASRLNASGSYRVLGQAAWTQAAAPWDSHRGVSLEQLGLGNGLSGAVIFERGQYLHLGFELQYTENGRTWVVNEMRRVKTNERQYYDHPAIGVIAILSPVTDG